MKVMKRQRFTLCVALVVAVGALMVDACHARTVLRNICRVKGQEGNTIRGIGLVVGLAGTGEAGDPVLMRALARAYQIMDVPVPEMPMPGSAGLKELEKVKNTALVFVTARIPATGSRRGDLLDCYVSGINGKSLAGGRLVFAAMRGPNVNDTTFYASCEGAIHLENPDQPLNGKITGGCQMEQDIITPFVQDGRITLVLDEHHANFQTATEVAESIHALYSREGDSFVKAISASNIVVQVPDEYENDPVAFAAAVLEATIYSPEPEARVVINQKTGSIVISGDVTIGDVVVSHKNVVVEAGATGAVFSPVDADQADDAKLQSLVTALNSIKVPHQDVVEIIKGIAQNGKLHGRLIVE
jgi:flagellar P-ring protein precursor FlgI